MTKLYATDVTKAKFKPILDKTLPDLKGYDEVHIITEEDFERLNHQRRKDQFVSSDFDPILGDSKLFDALYKSKQNEQFHVFASVLDVLAGDKKERDRRGPGALSVETQYDGKPYRVGFIFVMGNSQRNHEKLVLPSGINSQDRARTSFLNDPKYMIISEYFIVAHEVGHLVDNLKKGIQPLKADSEKNKNPLTTHPKEVVADTYANEVIESGIAGVETKYLNIYRENFFSNRSLRGVIDLITNPSGHFTTPFMTGGPFQNKRLEDFVQAGNNLNRRASTLIQTLFYKNLADFYSGKKPRDENDFGAICTNEAVQDVNQSIKRIKENSGTIPTKDKQDIALMNAFSNCAFAKQDFRHEILSGLVKLYDPARPEGLLLAEYMRGIQAFRGISPTASDPNQTPIPATPPQQPQPQPTAKP